MLQIHKAQLTLRQPSKRWTLLTATTSSSSTSSSSGLSQRFIL